MELEKEVSWYPNDGNGVFNQKITVLDEGFNVCHAKAADMDGDGDLDILTHGGNSDVLYLQNDGDSTFSTQIQISDDLFEPTDMEAADMDGDGDLDVISGSFQTGNIVWYENFGSGSFSSKRLLTGLLNRSHDLEFVDYDNDGDLDVVASLRYASGTYPAGIYYFENDFITSFTEVRPQASPIGTNIAIYGSGFATDGSDAVTIGGQTASISEVSDQKFTATIPTISTGFAEITIDGDFGSDTLVTPLLVNESKVIEFGPQIRLQENLSDGPGGIVAGDITGDGYNDIIVANKSSDEIIWFENNQDGTFGSENIFSTGTTDGPEDVELGDIDRDGDLDIVFGQFNDAGRIGWIRNDGASSFSFVETINFDNQVNEVRDIDLHDLDGDGYLDVLASSNGTSTPGIVWFRNEQKGTFENEARVIEAETQFINTEVHADDIDNDGDLDVLVSEYRADGDYFWYLNDGYGNFSSRDSLGITFSGAWTVETGDLNGDGYVDLITNETANNRTRWYANNRDGTFSTTGVDITTDSLHVAEFVAIDMDGDGDTDIISGDTRSGQVLRYMNDGSGNFTQVVITDDDTGAGSIQASDLDNDGDLDILFTSNNDGKVAWIENMEPTILLTQALPHAVPADTTIELYGTNFSLDGSDEVKIGETVASKTVRTANSMLVTVPSLSPGSYKVTISGSNGADTLTTPLTVIEKKEQYLVVRN